MTDKKQEMDHKKRFGKFVGFRANDEIYQAIKEIADNERRTVSQLLRIIAEDYLNENSKEE